jgi:ethanolamine utilization protein EutP
MRKLMLVGRVGAGKTTLTQALKGEQLHYCKTQYINYTDTIIDTPGEYTEVHTLSAALGVYSYEADVIGLVISANEPFCVFPPNCTCLVNREVIGIVTKIDKADPARAENWLRLSGCETVFHINSLTGEGIPELLAHLETNKNNI